MGSYHYLEENGIVSGCLRANLESFAILQTWMGGEIADVTTDVNKVNSFLVLENAT